MKVDKEHGLRIDDKRQDLINLEAEVARFYWEAIRQILPVELGINGRARTGKMELIKQVAKAIAETAS